MNLLEIFAASKLKFMKWKKSFYRRETYRGLFILSSRKLEIYQTEEANCRGGNIEDKKILK